MASYVNIYFSKKMYFTHESFQCFISLMVQSGILCLRITTHYNNVTIKNNQEKTIKTGLSAVLNLLY